MIHEEMLDTCEEILDTWIASISPNFVPPKTSLKNSYTKACWLLSVYQKAKQAGMPDMDKFILVLKRGLPILAKRYHGDP